MVASSPTRLPQSQVQQREWEHIATTRDPPPLPLTHCLPPRRFCSRDGRVNPPKLGMLRMVVDAVATGDVERVGCSAAPVVLGALCSSGWAVLQVEAGWLGHPLQVCSSPVLPNQPSTPLLMQPVWLVPTAMNYDALLVRSF